MQELIEQNWMTLGRLIENGALAGVQVVVPVSPEMNKEYRIGAFWTGHTRPVLRNGDPVKRPYTAHTAWTPNMQRALDASYKYLEHKWIVWLEVRTVSEAEMY